MRGFGLCRAARGIQLPLHRIYNIYVDLGVSFVTPLFFSQDGELSEGAMVILCINVVLRL